MGDFNAEATEQWYQLLSQNGVLDIYKGVHRQHPPFSFNNGKSTPKYIDFMLLQAAQSYGIKRIFLGNDPERVPDYETLKALPCATVPSDHLPITVDIQSPS
jgi:endonuclease/exonuclease/phosphatase family metal-dependent hydrolase